MGPPNAPPHTHTPTHTHTHTEPHIHTTAETYNHTQTHTLVGGLGNYATNYNLANRLRTNVTSERDLGSVSLGARASAAKR